MEDFDTIGIAELAEKAKEFAVLTGLQMRAANNLSTVHHGPFSLFPSIIPRKIMDEAKAAQKDFNLLMHKVAHDHKFLYESLQNVIKVDDFTKKLWDVYETVRKEGITQPICLGLFRNDYMMNTGGGVVTDLNELQLKQIEFNMIASSFAGLMSCVRDLHRYVMAQAGIDYDPEKMPFNDCASGLARGLIRSWEIYGEPSSYVLFLVDEGERNKMDQLWLEKEMFNLNRLCRFIHRTLGDVGQHGKLDDSKKLIVENKEIAVVYYRSGYVPSQYKSQKDWDTRLMIERSTAIKCPTVQYQLAGTKKVQQELAKEGAVEKFLSDPSAVERVRNTFAGQFSLDKGEDGDLMLSKAVENPTKYVVKPQREGGGNNIYDKDIPDFLRKIQDSDERSAYILMERIHPFLQQNFLIKMGEDIQLMDVVNEIGIYGVLIGSDSEIIENDEVGHLVRTKENTSNEGGIIVGFSVLDSPYLVTNSIEEGYLRKLKL